MQDVTGLAKMLLSKPKESPVFARYPVCPQCQQIMSLNTKKLKQVGERLFVHPSCYASFIQDALARVKERVVQSAAPKAEEPAP